MAKRPTTVPNTKMSGPFVDSLQNLMTGMGTDRDKLNNTTFGIPVFNATDLENAYRGDWIARKIVNIPAKDATREWRSWQADTDDINKIEELELNELSVQQKLKKALIKARLYGGAGLVLGVNQGSPDQELIVDRLGKGSLKFVHALSSNELSCGPIIYDINSPYFGEPEYYTINTTGKAAIAKVHPSRVVRLLGNEMPDIARASSSWGDSVLLALRDAIIQVGTVTNGFSQLVQEAKLDIIGIPGLTKNILNADYTNRVRERFSLASTAKSIYNLLLLDKEEEWHRMEVNFSGMPDMLKAYLLIASGAADIPATRMLGQSPAGLSATGESDIRNYYDSIAVDQETEIGPALKRLDEVLIRSALGAKPEGIFYNWNPLWQLSDAEKAKVWKDKADIFTADVNAGLINPEVLREARAAQLIEDGVYPGIESIIDEFGIEDEEPEVVGPPAMIPDPNDPTKMIPNPLAQKAPPVVNNNAEEDEDAEVVIDPALEDASRKAVRDMLKRIRLADAEPRSLYVRRQVLNANEIIAWAKSVGFETTIPAEEMHVTVAYSKQKVDWMKMGSDWGGDDENARLRIKPGGARLIEKFGDDVAVLVFTSSDLTWRWRTFKENGASWDWPDYQPHMTITKTWRDVYNTFEPYRGAIVLGPEIFEQVKKGAMEAVVEQ